MHNLLSLMARFCLETDISPTGNVISGVIEKYIKEQGGR
jgi:hypothetical protein